MELFKKMIVSILSLLLKISLKVKRLRWMFYYLSFKYTPLVKLAKNLAGGRRVELQTDWQWISDHDNNLWNILLKRRRYLKIYLRQHFFLHKFTVAKHKKSQTLMAARLDCQPIRRVENSSSGSMYKTNQSDFVTTLGLGIKKNLKGCFWMDLGDN